MKLVLDILQGAGLAAACGLRPFLPALLAGALASDNLGVDFSHTDYAFLESTTFLLILAVALVVSFLTLRRAEAQDGAVAAAMSGIGMGLGALLFAGSLADNGYTSWPGLIGGIACAALANASVRNLFARVRPRLDPAARAALPLYADGGGLALAGLSVLAPPVSILALAFLAWLLVGGRRRTGEKYAGLRILR
jgi:uncharacterized membrane protein YgdD (TMEM256/DUF423 family)